MMTSTRHYFPAFVVVGQLIPCDDARLAHSYSRMAANLHPDAPELYDAGDDEQVKKRGLSAKRREKESREVLAALLDTPAGRNWMWQLLSDANIFSANPPSDALTMAFNEGARNLGLRLLASITATVPDAMIQMMKHGGKE